MSNENIIKTHKHICLLAPAMIAYCQCLKGVTKMGVQLSITSVLSLTWPNVAPRGNAAGQSSAWPRMEHSSCKALDVRDGQWMHHDASSVISVSDECDSEWRVVKTIQIVQNIASIHKNSVNIVNVAPLNVMENDWIHHNLEQRPQTLQGSFGTLGRQFRVAQLTSVTSRWCICRWVGLLDPAPF